MNSNISLPRFIKLRSYAWQIGCQTLSVFEPADAVARGKSGMLFTYFVEYRMRVVIPSRRKQTFVPQDKSQVSKKQKIMLEGFYRIIHNYNYKNKIEYDKELHFIVCSYLLSSGS